MKKFPSKYKCIRQNEYSIGEYAIVPIRYEDRLDIMKWRNEQIYHLRQNGQLTPDDQDRYFDGVVSKLFEDHQPNQLLFSYLERGHCIGYGGLVHINWVDRNAEISFIMDTSLEDQYFRKHWQNYLRLIEKVASHQLGLYKIYTYAFDLRQELYSAIESVGFEREATLRNHCLYEGIFKDVVIHSKFCQSINFRRASKDDVKITFEWANDVLTRRNSFSSEVISFDEHKQWWYNKMIDENANYFICEENGIPAGLVRFDKASESPNLIIGVTLAPSHRGRGLAEKFLKLVCKEGLEETKDIIHAYIKESNLPSIRAFEKAGFELVEETEINGVVSRKYQLNKNEE
ncbi:GNAT family N-acetyltransferase [Sphingobacterium bovistauri]|uniref:GNAT family N-acetyltransferase n=1 Tax=Sphingobacterium bovistauri TaxID=2781959 RepID=A0ABS7Z1N3_9SPHI|nr:GNAT family N-acetyltransferase [Sphingobacterium bovistauri]MCA5004086.1 GNAT family N-acetyltransferase [Sphingobacterium bovistauri]